jgi:hypothetical protein
MRLALGGGQNNCYPYFSGQVRLAQDKCREQTALIKARQLHCGPA